MENINPLTDEQLDEAIKHFNGRNVTRFMANGYAVDIQTGECAPKHTNTIYHVMYWKCTDEFNALVLKYLQENNPGVLFRALIHGIKEVS